MNHKEFLSAVRYQMAERILAIKCEKCAVEVIIYRVGDNLLSNLLTCAERGKETGSLFSSSWHF